jgi:hypothetical protein
MSASIPLWLARQGKKLDWVKAKLKISNEEKWNLSVTVVGRRFQMYILSKFVKYLDQWGTVDALHPIFSKSPEGSLFLFSLTGHCMYKNWQYFLREYPVLMRFIMSLIIVVPSPQSKTRSCTAAITWESFHYRIRQWLDPRLCFHNDNCLARYNLYWEKS